VKPWPLEQVVYLDTAAIASIVQSLSHSELSRCGTPNFVFYSSQEFLAMRWKALGLNQNSLMSLTSRCNSMFQTNLRPPRPDEICHIFCDDIWKTWSCGSRIISFLSSGTTGQPKVCSHHEDDLRQEVSSAAPQLEYCKRAIVTMPLYHIYGLVYGILLPMSLQLPTSYIFPLPTIISAKMQPGDLVMGIPLLWKSLVQTRQGQLPTERGKGITLLTATSPLPLELGRELLEQGFSIFDIFGYSEAGSVCCRRHPDEPFTLFPHIQRDKDPCLNQFIRRLPSGTIRHYSQVDHMTWINERQFILGTRIDSAVQVCGINVYPQEVARILEKNSGVKKCVVRLMRPEEGYKLKAFVVPMPGYDQKTLHTTLQTYAKKHLTIPQRPGSYTFGDDIPIGSTGKPTDW